VPTKYFLKFRFFFWIEGGGTSPIGHAHFWVRLLYSTNILVGILFSVYLLRSDIIYIFSCRVYGYRLGVRFCDS